MKASQTEAAQDWKKEAQKHPLFLAEWRWVFNFPCPWDWETVETFSFESFDVFCDLLETFKKPIEGGFLQEQACGFEAFAAKF